MTDQELLTLAAKADGREVFWKKYCYDGIAREGLFCAITGHKTTWNPLTDDGDALRLAVKLGLLNDVGSSLFFADAEDKTVVFHGSVNDARVQVTEETKGDPYAATRRAIVRAAAAIGEKMP